ncbi:hypothetical protein OXX79_008098 [Metschnikowia pulcherrima]
MKSIQLLFPLGVFSTMVAAAPLATTSGSIMADPSVAPAKSLDIRDLSGNRDLSKREEVVRLTNEQKQKQIQKDLKEETGILREWILTDFNDLTEIPSYSLYNTLAERAGEVTTTMFNVEKELDFFRKLLNEMDSASETLEKYKGCFKTGVGYVNEVFVLKVRALALFGPDGCPDNSIPDYQTKLSEIATALSVLEDEVASANDLPKGFQKPFSKHVEELKAKIAILEETPDQKCDWA